MFRIRFEQDAVYAVHGKRIVGRIYFRLLSGFDAGVVGNGEEALEN